MKSLKQHKPVELNLTFHHFDNYCDGQLVPPILMKAVHLMIEMFVNQYLKDEKNYDIYSDLCIEICNRSITHQKIIAKLVSQI